MPGVHAGGVDTSLEGEANRCREAAGGADVAYNGHLRQSLVIADTAQTCIDCKIASLPVSWVLLLQSSCGYPRTDTDKQAWTHRHGNMDTQTHRQTVLRHAYDHKLVPLWKILPPIWVTIHGLMPSASNPWPAGQGYMAVHQSSHNSARFIAPSVRHCCTSPPRRRRSAKDAQYEGALPISHCRAKKALNCEQ